MTTMPGPGSTANAGPYRGHTMNASRRIIVAAVALLVAASAPAGGQAASRPVADPADVATPDAIIAALYDVISGPAGPRDWDRFRSLFHPSARLAATRAGRDGQQASLWVGSPDDYVTRNGPFFNDNAFYEDELARTEAAFGAIRHAFSTYASRRAPGAEPFARGINSIQLFHDGQRWWIVTVLWDSERPGLTLPERYLAAPPPGPAPEG